MGVALGVLFGLGLAGTLLWAAEGSAPPVGAPHAPVVTASPEKTPTTAESHEHAAAWFEDAIKSIDAATKAVESGDKAKALAELKTVRETLVKRHEAMMKAAEPVKVAVTPAVDTKVVNDRCPMRGVAIDTAHLVPGQTRVWKGQTVAFCCTNCPGAWDKLTADQKDAKLKAVLAAK